MPYHRTRAQERIDALDASPAAPSAELEAVKAELQAVYDDAVPAFDEALRKAGVGHLVSVEVR
jgi:hypothetical protein